MQQRPFTDRTAAHKWAARRRAASSDRVILACEVCPRMTRSKRVAPRWSVIAAAVAAAVGARPVDVRVALTAALASERQRGTGIVESRTKENGEAA